MTVPELIPHHVAMTSNPWDGDTTIEVYETIPGKLATNLLILANMEGVNGVWIDVSKHPDHLNVRVLSATENGEHNDSSRQALAQLLRDAAEAVEGGRR